MSSWANRLAQVAHHTPPASKKSSTSTLNKGSQSKFITGTSTGLSLGYTPPPLGYTTSVVLAAWLNDMPGEDMRTPLSAQVENRTHREVLASNPTLSELQCALPRFTRAGLENTGNSCFLNAALQSLVAIPQCAVWFQKLAALPQDVIISMSTQYPYLAELSQFLKAVTMSDAATSSSATGGGIQSVTASISYPRIIPRFANSLRRAAIMLGTQNDANELMLHLVDAWHTELASMRDTARQVINRASQYSGTVWHSLNEETQVCILAMCGDSDKTPVERKGDDLLVLSVPEVCSSTTQGLDLSSLSQLTWSELATSPELLAVLIFAEHRVRALEIAELAAGSSNVVSSTPKPHETPTQPEQTVASETKSSEVADSITPYSPQQVVVAESKSTPEASSMSTPVMTPSQTQPQGQTPVTPDSSDAKRLTTQQKRRAQKVLEITRAWYRALPQHQKPTTADTSSTMTRSSSSSTNQSSAGLRATTLATQQARLALERFVRAAQSVGLDAPDSDDQKHSPQFSRSAVVASSADEHSWAVETAEADGWVEVGTEKSRSSRGLTRSSDVTIATPTVLSSLFSGRLRMALQGRGEGQKSSVSYQPYLSIGLPLVPPPGRTASIDCLFSALNAFYATSHINTNDGTFLEQRTTIEHPLPPVLFFQINRFILDMQGNATKVTKYFRFPMALRATPAQISGKKTFIPMSSSQYTEPAIPKPRANAVERKSSLSSSSAAAATTVTASAEVNTDNDLYVLRALVCHEGDGVARGHFICYIPDRSRQSVGPTTWYKLDDAVLTPTPEAVVKRLENVYALFYSRWNSSDMSDDLVSSVVASKDSSTHYQLLHRYLEQERLLAEDTLVRLQVEEEREKAQAQAAESKSDAQASETKTEVPYSKASVSSASAGSASARTRDKPMQSTRHQPSQRNSTLKPTSHQHQHQRQQNTLAHHKVAAPITATSATKALNIPAVKGSTAPVAKVSNTTAGASSAKPGTTTRGNRNMDGSRTGAARARPNNLTNNGNSSVPTPRTQSSTPSAWVLAARGQAIPKKEETRNSSQP